MVFVLNGEVLPDNDPRVVQHKQQQQRQRPSQPQQRQPTLGLHSSGATNRPPPAGGVANPGAPPAQAGPLYGLAAMIGVQNQSLTIPAVPAVGLRNEMKVPLIYVIVAAIVIILLNTDKENRAMLVGGVGLLFFLSNMRGGGGFGLPAAGAAPENRPQPPPARR